MAGGSTNVPDSTNGSTSIITNVDSVEDIGCCDPRKGWYRFIALVLMCFLGFGSYFCFDNPGALTDHFKEDLKLTQTQYMFLYSIYSWPNTVLCLVGGYLIDSVFGIRLGTIVYMVILLIGQFIFAAGGFYDTYIAMVVGRFIFGIGAESLAVATNSYAVLWFKGKELNLVFGLQLSFARLGSTVNFTVMESLYKWVTKTIKGPQGIGVVLFIASLTCVFSLICALILGAMDKRAGRVLHRDENFADPVRLKDVKEFPATFWLVSVICVAYYVAIFPFIASGKDFFMKRFKLSGDVANFLCSMVYVISAGASPIFGIILDKTGTNVTWILSSVVMTITAHTMLGFTMITPYIAMVLMGLSYSLLASGLWPLVSLVVPESQLGTAYGICQAVQNFGLAIINILLGVIIQHYGFVWSEAFLICSLSVALLSAVLLWVCDKRSTGVLNMTPYAREIFNSRRSDLLERERLLADPMTTNPNDLLQSQSPEFEIRNRYLSRIGATLPAHYNVDKKAFTRALR